MPPQTPAQDDEEDYMSMTIIEPHGRETLAQRKLRKQREAEARAKVPSKAELTAQEAAQREAALSSSVLDPLNKGYKMMAKLGFKPGDALGKRTGEDGGNDKEKSSTAAANNWVRTHTEPLSLVLKEDRGGIGLDSEKKRKLRQEAEKVVKRAKAEEGEYRDRMRLEREERRAEVQVLAAQNISEKLDAIEGEEGEGEQAKLDSIGETASSDIHTERKKADRNEEHPTAFDTVKKRFKIQQTSTINILYRGLVREREERESSRLSRHALETSLPSSSSLFFPNPRLPSYESSTVGGDDEHLLGVEQDNLSALSFVEQGIEEQNDPELDEFNALKPQERLRRLVIHLREKHQYCFWCKHRYETAEMAGCPGTTEEDHD